MSYQCITNIFQSCTYNKALLCSLVIFLCYMKCCTIWKRLSPKFYFSQNCCNYNRIYRESPSTRIVYPHISIRDLRYISIQQYIDTLIEYHDMLHKYRNICYSAERYMWDVVNWGELERATHIHNERRVSL